MTWRAQRPRQQLRSHVERRVLAEELGPVLLRAGARHLVRDEADGAPRRGIRASSCSTDFAGTSRAPKRERRPRSQRVHALVAQRLVERRRAAHRARATRAAASIRSCSGARRRGSRARRPRDRAAVSGFAIVDALAQFVGADATARTASRRRLRPAGARTRARCTPPLRRGQSGKRAREVLADDAAPQAETRGSASHGQRRRAERVTRQPQPRAVSHTARFARFQRL